VFICWLKFLQVLEPAEGDIPTDNVTVGDFWVAKHPNASTGAPNELTEVPFLVKLPRDKTLKVEAAILTPVEDGVALMHVHSVRLGPLYGRECNVMAATESIPLIKIYPNARIKTSKVKTFMQVRSYFMYGKRCCDEFKTFSVRCFGG